MGCCFSSRCRSPSTFNTIRLVHLDGYVKDFDHPISVSEVIGKPPKQFLCTAAQLMSTGFNPLNLDAQLQPGHIYFVLPLSTLQDDISPLDMASVVRRLTARAKSIRSDAVSPKTGLLWSQTGLGSEGNSSVRIPRRLEGREMTHDLQNSCRARARSWKPVLDTIKETSFTRRSESDLREMQFITKK
ncbi:uncharacterized protein LOC110410266 [Herrania umbratica]|uniref:Uncharacterized protein LOC110410266 n=1 Tax=Herrania umbratica TaxID=108875 RepID=A0A6J0ZM84_9ROSI|nr:uncharacterized protein LOC110410266 [Herrania umbratica]